MSENIVLHTGAFSSCNNLVSVTLPKNLTAISEACFRGCNKLETIDLPEGLLTIGRYAFEGCGFTQFHIPETVTTISYGAFSRCNNLTEIVIPASVTFLSGFNECYNLERVEMHNSGIIDSYAFSYCKNLSSVFVGENITKISTCVFQNCTGLKEITFEGDAPLIDSYAFQYVTATVTAHYPMIASWTEDKLQNYGGNITWVGYSVCTEHEYSAVVTAPTCTEQGFTTYTCTICGESYVGDEVEATGHSYEATVTDPTCNKRGFTTYTCSVCGDSYADDYVDALGHKFEDEICTVCGSPERIPGDIDGNEIVDVDDVLALLWHVLFPDDYPIEAEADFDGNETVDVDDVLALLWHVLFPEEYPI